MPTPLMHYICWFTHGSDPGTGFVPADGGCQPESDQQAWEMGEVLRTGFGINLEAFVPVLKEIGRADPARLPGPARCLDVLSEGLIAEARSTEFFVIKDIFHSTKQIPGPAVADWLESYRRFWQRGFYVVRVPDPAR